MSQTQNLGLPIYEANDKPSWMDTNNGFEKLDNIVGGVASVQLDFANPLYIFDDTHLSYTATEDCWLFGVYCAMTTSTLGTISVDGQVILKGYFQDGNGLTQNPTVFVRIARGSTVTISNMNAISAIACYPGEIVSDSFVWNEAIVELDYANPLHEFTSGNLSYTATKDCWLVGTRIGPSSMSINGKAYINGYSGESAYVFYKLSAGDVVTSTGVQSNVFVLDGTIKGSAPGNGGGGDVLELLDFDNAVAVINAGVVTTYTAPKAGALYGAIATAGSGYVTVDGKQVAKFNANEPIPSLEVQGIQKGSVITATGTPNNTSYVYFVPYKYESIAPEITVYNEAELEFDYANPLFDFNTGTTYTATEDCYVVGSLSNARTLTINSIVVCGAPSDACLTVCYKIKKDDVVTITSTMAGLHIYKGTKVGSVGNLTGAWIPNYSDHIATLTYNGGTYTATEDCIVEIGSAPPSNSTAKVKVNGYVVATSYSASNGFYGFEKTIPLKKGDVLTFENMSQSTFHGEVFGLM